MKFFDAIFKKKKETETIANTSVSKSKEAQSLKELEGFLQKLQESDHYIARSEILRAGQRICRKCLQIEASDKIYGYSFCKNEKRFI